jgi:PAS domain S-box-containing protein
LGKNTQVQHLLGLSGTCATALAAAPLIDEALPILLGMAGARAALVVRRDTEGYSVSHAIGAPLGAADVEPTADSPSGGLHPVAVPESWQDQGVKHVGVRSLPGHHGLLALAWATETVAVPELDVAVSLLEAALARLEATGDLRDLSVRVDNAQHLAHMGDYDWHIPSDTNRWSDELFRIYGHEPGSFEPSYDKFMSLIHPEDRERITAVHQQAYATGEPYQMIERIVRPDGEVRHLASNGEVVMDEQGVPLRMRGTCIDITDRVHAERDREDLAAHQSQAQLRRRQALEINDNVVQGLVAATYALDAEQYPVVATYLDRTLTAARTMMDDLLEPLDGQDLTPGDLVRSEPARIGLPEASTPPPAPPAPGSSADRRVLVVDDADDLRRLMRDRLERADGYTVVGEAADGVAAVELARELQPDLVLLDLAMPRMDGLEALPLIREAVPEVRVVVFSGFNQNTLAEKAMRAGADRYVVKGGSLRELISLLDTVLQPLR